MKNFETKLSTRDVKNDFNFKKLKSAVENKNHKYKSENKIRN